jgi:hypothetical protein
MQANLPSWKDGEKKQTIQIPWKSLQLLVPHRMRRRLRSKIRNRTSPASSITALKTSFSPSETLRSLQSHRWTLYDGQWLFLAIVGIFSLSIIESPGPLVKTAVATLLLSSFIFPITRQFFRPFTPIAAYLIFFYACRYVPMRVAGALLTLADSFPQAGDLRYGSKSFPRSKTSSTAQISVTSSPHINLPLSTYSPGFPTVWDISVAHLWCLQYSSSGDHLLHSPFLASPSDT